MTPERAVEASVLDRPISPVTSPAEPDLKPSEKEADEPQLSQFRQFAEVVVALKAAREAAILRRADLEFLPPSQKSYLREMAQRQLKHRQSLAHQVEDPRSQLTLEAIHSPSDREKVRIMLTRPEDEVVDVIVEQYLSDPLHTHPDQERFAVCMLMARRARKNQQRLDELSDLGRDRTRHESTEYHDGKLSLIRFNHVVKGIIMHADDSITRERLAGWIAQAGAWPQGLAEALVAGMTAEVVTLRLVRNMKNDENNPVTQISLPKPEEDLKGIDLKIGGNGRLYSVDIKSGGSQKDGEGFGYSKNGNLEIYVPSTWIQEFDVKDEYRADLQRRILKACNLL